MRLRCRGRQECIYRAIGHDNTACSGTEGMQWETMQRVCRTAENKMPEDQQGKDSLTRRRKKGTHGRKKDFVSRFSPT